MIEGRIHGPGHSTSGELRPWRVEDRQDSTIAFAGGLGKKKEDKEKKEKEKRNEGFIVIVIFIDIIIVGMRREAAGSFPSSYSLFS